VSILLVGLGAGFLSGVFGVGGGILIVPGLVFFAKMDQRRAHGTSLAAVLPISLASLVTYWSHDHVVWYVALWLAIGAVGGAILGTKLLKTARHDVLSYGFATVLIVSAIRLYWTSSADGRTDLTVVAAIALVVIGVATGTLAGLLGVGGGVIMIPAMVLLLGEMNVMAKGTSLAVIIPTSITGTIRNRKTANVDVKAAVVVGLSGVISAVAGGSLAANMSESLSNALFATLLLVVAVQMIYRERRVRSSNAPTQ
jgi:uncharacterized membrane protein YfcA